MIKKIITATFIAVSLPIFGQGIQFEEGKKLSEILAKAKHEKKLVFIDGYTSWCAPCKLMSKKTFPLQSVGELYNAKFINAKFDMEKGEGITIAKKYKINRFPSYLFLDSDGKVVHSANSYMDENEFLQFGKNALDPEQRVGALKKKFEAGDKDLEFLKNLAALTSNEPEYNYKVLSRYFDVKKNIDRDDAMILFTSLNSTEDPRYQLLQKNKAKIAELLGEKDFLDYDNFIKLRSIRAKATNTTTKAFNDKIFLSEAEKYYSKDEAGQLLKDTKMDIALENNNFAEYEGMALEKYQDNYSNVPYFELYTAANNFAEHINTKSSLETALLWAKDSEKRRPNMRTEFTLAKLFKKLGDKTNAKAYAEKSLQAFKNSKFKDPDTIASIEDFFKNLE